MIREVSFNGNRIRIFDDGNIWVYATDIAKLLEGANNVTQLTRNLSDSDIKRVDGHRTIVINEAGFYNMTAGKKNGSELRKFAEENIFMKIAPKEETGVTIYSNDQFGDLRSIERGGEIWFAAPDVCRSLQIQNTTQALVNLDADERSMFYIGPQVEMNFVSEPGLYTLISRSNKPSAKTFRRWVTHEVLPSIRKTGSYSVTGNTDDDILRQAFDILQRRNNEWQAKYEAVLAERNNLQLQLDNVKKPLDSITIRCRMIPLTTSITTAKFYTISSTLASAHTPRSASVAIASGWVGATSTTVLKKVSAKTSDFAASRTSIILPTKKCQRQYTLPIA